MTFKIVFSILSALSVLAIAWAVHINDDYRAALGVVCFFLNNLILLMLIER